MKPILFSTEMVKAILDGRKTVTRRVVKPQPESDARITVKDGAAYICGAVGGQCTRMPAHYQPGDILWVRETWAKRIHSDNRYYYKADNNLGAVFNRENDKWRPSIFMPRAAARLFLLVKTVRAERLQEISHFEAQCEGVAMASDDDLKEYGYRAGFKQLWDSLNKKRGYSWESNPWVWVYSFERMEVE